MTASADRPDRRWRPTQFRVSGVYRRTAKVWVTDRRTGDRVRRAQPRYDVRWRVDGRLYKYTLEQRGWADDFARRLVEDFARGWHFDADARQFADPTATTPDQDGGEDEGVSFYDLVVTTPHASGAGGRRPAAATPSANSPARACSSPTPTPPS